MSYQGKWMCIIQDYPSRTDSGGEWICLTDLNCPASGCPSSEGVSWVCGQDGNRIYVNEYGTIKCALSEDSEGIHTGYVGQSGWKCGNTFHRGEFMRSDIPKFMTNLSFL